MPNYLVYGTGSAGKEVAEALGCEFRIPPKKIKERRELAKKHTIINFGWSTKHAALNKNPERIKDKAYASKKMLEEGVPAVKYTDIRGFVGTLEMPCLLRKARHSKGRDIIHVKTGAELVSAGMTNYYHVPIFDKEREFRVHVMLGASVKIQEKISKSEMTRQERMRSICWNQDNSIFIRRRLSSLDYEHICNISERAVSALGLDFGAVDIGIGRGDYQLGDIEGTNECYECSYYDTSESTCTTWDKPENCHCLAPIKVFEVNTAPAMNTHTAEEYARVIKQYMGYHSAEGEEQCTL